MQQCPNCGHHNRAGIVFCENCGASLIGKTPLSTKSLESSSEEERSQLGVDSSVLTDVQVQGIAIFEEGSSLRLEIDGSPEPIIFKPAPETIFGRRDPATGAMPDIDLTPFAGYRMGVSRRHAAIRHGEDMSLEIWDLGSSNGTFLNSQRLSAHRPYRLRDGDELRLGQMIIRVYFQPGEKAGPAEPVPARGQAAVTQPPVVTLPAAEAQPKIVAPVMTAPPATAPLADQDAAGAETSGDKEAAAQAEAPTSGDKPAAPSRVQPPAAASVGAGESADARPSAPGVEEKKALEVPPAAAITVVQPPEPLSPTASPSQAAAEPKAAANTETQPEGSKTDQPSEPPKPDAPPAS